MILNKTIGMSGLLNPNKFKLPTNFYIKPFSVDNKFFTDFHQLDKIPQNKADFLIESMEQMMKFPSIVQIKTRAIKQLCDQLPPNKQSLVFDIGCGCGYDTLNIANQSDQIEAIGIDNSQLMISKAQKHVHPRVKYLVEDINNIKIKADAAYVDRLFVSSANPNNLFNNIIRLIKPLGIISITDVDALSIILYPYNKTTQIILDKLQQGFVNPYMGRKLPELFIHDRINNFEVNPAISMVRNFQDLCKIFNFHETIDSLVFEGKLTVSEGNDWLNNMNTASNDGKFMYSVTFYTVQGYLKS
jgi:ubiquinone/menaquinone biosynthesis C-methylase UbiE